MIKKHTLYVARRLHPTNDPKIFTETFAFASADRNKVNAFAYEAIRQDPNISINIYIQTEIFVETVIQGWITKKAEINANEFESPSISESQEIRLSLDSSTKDTE